MPPKPLKVKFPSDGVLEKWEKGWKDMEVRTSIRALLSAALRNKIKKIFTVRLRPRHRNKHQRASLLLQQEKHMINISLKLTWIGTLTLYFT